MAIIEIAGEIGEEGVEVIDPNIGGTAEFDWGSVRLTPALAHLDDAQGHGQHAGRAWSSSSATSGSTTWATPRCSATSRCPSAAATSTWR